MNWLEQAHAQYAAGKHEKAITTLSTLAQLYDPTETQAEDMLRLASAIQESTGKDRVRNRCEKVIGDLNVIIARYRNDPFCVAAVRECRVLGGGGLPPRVGEVWELDFDHDELVMKRQGSEAVLVPYSEIVALEIGGPGTKKQGGGFIGGGFGLEGAIEGMLIATALNLVTTRTSITTVICLKTRTAEVYLLNTEEAPDDLRMRMAPVFVRLRQEAERSLLGTTQVEPASADVIDRLHKLSELLEKGLLTEDEFAALKVSLLATVDRPLPR